MMQSPPPPPPGLEGRSLGPFAAAAVSPVGTRPTAQVCLPEQKPGGMAEFSVLDAGTKAVLASEESGQLADEVRRAIMKDVEQELVDRLMAVWNKGAMQMQQVQLESDQRLEDLTRRVTEFQEAQAVLEAENEKLKQVIAGLGNQLVLISAAFGGGGRGQAGGLWGQAAAACNGLAGFPQCWGDFDG